MSEGSVARFYGLAEGYDRFRPRYPSAAIEDLLRGLPARPLIADVGAGTGIGTRALAAAGARVVAIEPNDEMRALARSLGADARPGSATATGLPAASVDAVTCFQAFHWFAHGEALAEFRRILRPRGRVALVWNDRDMSDPFTREVRRIEEHAAESARLAGMDFIDELLEPLLQEAGFALVRRPAFDYRQAVDEEGLIGRIRSTSYAPRTGPELDTMIGQLRELYARYAGPAGAELRYRTDLVVAELPA